MSEDWICPDCGLEFTKEELSERKRKYPSFENTPKRCDGKGFDHLAALAVKVYHLSPKGIRASLAVEALEQIYKILDEFYDDEIIEIDKIQWGIKAVFKRVLG